MKEEEEWFVLVLFEIFTGELTCFVGPTFIMIKTLHRPDESVVVSVKPLVDAKLTIQDEGAYYCSCGVASFVQYFGDGEIGLTQGESA